MRTMRRRRLDDDDDVSGMAEDGETIRCPLYLMDGVQRQIADAYQLSQPGYRSVNDSDVLDAQHKARLARQQWIADLQTQWRLRDAAQPDLSARPDELLMRRHMASDPDADDDPKLAAIRERDFRLQNAWRSPGLTDPGAANAVERQRQRWTVER